MWLRLVRYATFLGKQTAIFRNVVFWKCLNVLGAGLVNNQVTHTARDPKSASVNLAYLR